MLALALGSGVLGAAACSEQTAPSGKGDNVIVDVDATAGQGDNGGGDDGAVDEVFASVESGYPAPPDGYAPFDWCSQCACPSGTFCFGGGTGYETFSGDCHADAGALGTAPLAIGCYPFPPTCASQPSCDCLIVAISQLLGSSQNPACYPVCSITSNIVYCPHP
jgi:hypothetical protein